MHRLIIFADPSIKFALPLVESILTAHQLNSKAGTISICLTSRDRESMSAYCRSLLGYASKVLFNPTSIRRFHVPRYGTLSALARKYGVELITPPDFQINDSQFIQSLNQEDKPLFAISVGCLQIWSAALLNKFEAAINFHNGYLPDYKGLMVTHWSVFNREAESGFTFHIMDADIDTGPIIYRERIKIQPASTVTMVEKSIQRAACDAVPNIVSTLLSDSLNREDQPEGGTYYSGRKLRQIRKVDDPGLLDAEQLIHQLYCFAPLQIRINDQYYPVTSLRIQKDSSKTLTFRTADGVLMRPARLRFLPTWLYRLVAGSFNDDSA